MLSAQYSRTALVVAGGVVLASRDPVLREVVPPDAASLTRTLLDGIPHGRRLLRWIESRTGRAGLRLLERLTIPGIIAHWNCRKRWIDEAWRQAKEAGFDTLIIAGCGYDTLSIRVARQEPGVRTIDVDHPKTLETRRAGIGLLGGAAPILVAHDLGSPGLAQALQRVLPANASTFLLIEGVLMYLDPPRVSALLGEIASLPCAALRLVFTFMETSFAAKPAFQPRSRLVDAWLWLAGEPFKSGMTAETLQETLAGYGFALRALERRPGHSGLKCSLPTGECAAVADRSRIRLP